MNTKGSRPASLAAARSLDVNEGKLREAIHIVWRNLPGFPTTFGPCARHCGRGIGGRGSGPCVVCAQDDLAALVGEELAAKYLDAVRAVRDIEETMLRHPNESSSATAGQRKEQPK